MTLSIRKDSIDKEDLIQIFSDLSISEKNSYTGSPQVFSFFKEDDKYVRLPLYYGICLYDFMIKQYEGTATRKTFLFGLDDITVSKHINKKFSKINLGEFNGELREGQNIVIDNTIETLKRCQCGIIEATTGSGKTAMGIYLTSILRYRTLVISPLTKVASQWVSGYENFLPDAEVFEVPAGKDIEIPESAQVVICYYGRLINILQEYRKTFGFILIDEIHLCCNNTFIEGIFSGFEPRYIIGQTATLQKKNGLDIMSTYIAGEPITTEFVKNWKMYVFERPEITIPVALQKNGRPSWPETLNNICSSEEYSDFVIDVIEKNYEKHKILVLVMRIDAVEALLYKVRERGIKCDYITRDHRIIKPSRRVVIASEKLCGTGFDEGDCEERFNMIIRFGAGKDIPQFKQNLGRGFRSTNPIAVLITPNNSIARSHNKAIMDYAREDPTCTICEIRTVNQTLRL